MIHPLAIKTPDDESLFGSLFDAFASNNNVPVLPSYFSSFLHYSQLVLPDPYASSTIYVVLDFDHQYLALSSRLNWQNSSDPGLSHREPLD